MKLSKSVKPISHIKQNTAQVIKEINEFHETVIITQNGEEKTVLLNIGKYEQDMESLAMLKMISMSAEAYRSGEFKSAKKAFSDIKSRMKNLGQ